jgi:hypothetical protein
MIRGPLTYHTMLAYYFCSQPLYLDDDFQKKPHLRKCTEQPWQQFMGKLNEALCQTLTSLKFVCAKSKAAMVDGLLFDYYTSVNLLHDDQLNNVLDYRNFILENAEFLRKNPETCIQLAILEDRNSSIGKNAREVARESSITCLEPVRIDSSKSYNCILRLKAHNEKILSLTYDIGNESLVSCDTNEVIHWDLNSGAITSRAIASGNSPSEIKTGREFLEFIDSIRKQSKEERIEWSIFSPDSSVCAMLTRTTGYVRDSLGFHADNSPTVYYVKVISVSSGNIISDLGFDYKVKDVAFSPDSNLLALLVLGPTFDTVGKFNTLILWDLGKNLKIHGKEYELKIDHISFSKNGSFLFCHEYRRIYAFNISDWSLQFETYIDTESIVGILALNDTYLLAWGRHFIKLLNTHSEQFEHGLSLNQFDWINTVAYSDYRREFAIGFQNGKIELIKVEHLSKNQDEVKSSHFSFNSIARNALLFSPDNKRIAVAFNKYEFKILDLKSNSLIASHLFAYTKPRTDYTQPQESRSDEIRSFRFTNDGRSIILSCLTNIVDKNSPPIAPGFGPKSVPYGTVIRVSTSDLADEAFFKCNEINIFSQSVSPDDYAVFVRFDFRHFTLLRSGSLEKIKEYNHEGRDLVFSPDGSHLLALSDIISLLKNKSVFSLTKSTFEGSEFSPDSVLLPFEADNKINLISILKLSELTSLDLAHITDSDVASLMFSPDGRRLLIFRRQPATTPEKLRKQVVTIWNFRESKSITLERSSFLNRETSFRFSPDGSLIYGFEELFVNVWQASSGNLLTLIPSKKISAFDYSHDGSFICVAQYGSLNFFRLINFSEDPPVVTARRVYLVNTKCWQKEITAVCPHCGHTFIIPSSVQDAIIKTNKDASLDPYESPCLRLPDKAWDEPVLSGECPACEGRLKFNPFIAGGESKQENNWQFWKR